MKLIMQALTKFVLGLILISALLFLPAWSLDYTGAWLFIALLFVPMLIMGIVLLIKAPSLPEKRLSGKEKQKTQRGVVALSGLLFPIGFILCSLDFRFSLSAVPAWLVAVASVLFLIGYAEYKKKVRHRLIPFIW